MTHNQPNPYLYTVSPVDQINMSTYYNPPSVQYLGNCNTPANSNMDWIDEYLRTNFKYGYKVINEDTGATQLSLIPSWLVNWDTIQTPANSRGYKMGGLFTSPGSNDQWQQYIKIVGDKAFQYKRNVTTGAELVGGDWLFSIPNDYIRSISGGKIIQPHQLFAKVATPITNYIDPLTGQLNAGNIAVPIVYSVTNTGSGDITTLKAILTPSSLNSNIVSQLTTPKGVLWNSNPLQNTVTGFNSQNLDNLINVAIDGTTLRAVITGQSTTGSGTNSGGAGDRTGGTFLKSYTYTDTTTLEGEGTTAIPIKIKDKGVQAKHYIPSYKKINNQYAIPLTTGNAVDNYALNTVLWTTFGDLNIDFANFRIEAYSEYQIGSFGANPVGSGYGKFHMQISTNLNFSNPISIVNDDTQSAAWNQRLTVGNHIISKHFFFDPSNSLPSGQYFVRMGISWESDVTRRLYTGAGNFAIIKAFARA